MKNKPPIPTKKELSELKKIIKQLKNEFQEIIDNDQDYQGEGDIMLGALLNAEKSLEQIQDMYKCKPQEQARILADIFFVVKLINEGQEEDEEDLFDEDFDDEELEPLFADEDE